MTQRKCRNCSQLFLIFKNLTLALYKGFLDCILRLRKLKGNKDKVSLFSEHSKNCGCESHPVSYYSPKPLSNSETVSRFVFSPLHIDDKGKFKSSLFSHVSTRGCSIQREHLATNEEILQFVSGFLEGGSDRMWNGVAVANVQDIKDLTTTSGHRSVCVYDTSNRDNPAHAELFQAQEMDEADKIELRKLLMDKFSVRSNMLSPSNYRYNLKSNLKSELLPQVK